MSEGGLGMVDIMSRNMALKVSLISSACNVEHLQFWQVHLFSFFSIPFQVVINANLSTLALKFLLRKPLPLFWQSVFENWIKFHFVKNSSPASTEQLEEFICRPVAFNAAFGTNITSNNKRYSESLKLFFADHKVITVKDLCLKNEEEFPDKGYISRLQVKHIKSSIPLHWKTFAVQNPHTDKHTIGHLISVCRLSQKQIYLLILKQNPCFQEVIQRWNNEGFNVDWPKLTKSVKCILNGSIKCFFLLFNSRSYHLNNALSHFMLVSEFCSFCKGFKETYTHLFWDCPKSQTLWKYVHSLIDNKYANQGCSMFPVNTTPKVVFLFTLCKHYIFTCRSFSKKLNVHVFKYKLNFHLKILKYIYASKSKENIFEKWWGSLYQSLNA